MWQLHTLPVFSDCPDSFPTHQTSDMPAGWYKLFYYPDQQSCKRDWYSLLYILRSHIARLKTHLVYCPQYSQAWTSHHLTCRSIWNPCSQSPGDSQLPPVHIFRKLFLHHTSSILCRPDGFHYPEYCGKYLRSCQSIHWSENRSLLRCFPVNIHLLPHPYYQTEGSRF